MCPLQELQVAEVVCSAGCWLGDSVAPQRPHSRVTWEALQHIFDLSFTKDGKAEVKHRLGVWRRLGLLFRGSPGDGTTACSQPQANAGTQPQANACSPAPDICAYLRAGRGLVVGQRLRKRDHPGVGLAAGPLQELHNLLAISPAVGQGRVGGCCGSRCACVTGAAGCCNPGERCGQPPVSAPSYLQLTSFASRAHAP